MLSSPPIQDKSLSLTSILPQQRPQEVTQQSVVTTSISHSFPASVKFKSPSERLSKPLLLTLILVKMKKVNINYFPSLLILAETLN